MTRNVITPKLTYHPLLKGGLTPTIHRFGPDINSPTYSPDYSVLKPFEPMASFSFGFAQRQEPRQSPARSRFWQLQESPLAIQQDQGTLGYLYHWLFQNYAYPWNASRQHFFEREVDVLEPDGKISKEEVAHYLYRADQAGNKDGYSSQAELKFGQFVAQKRFLMEEGARLGLNKKELVALYQKLRSNQFSASTATFEEANDVIGQQTDTHHAITRLNQIIDNWEQCTAWTEKKMPTEKTAILKNLLQYFLQSGSMPLPEYQRQPINSKAPKTPHHLSFIMMDGVTTGLNPTIPHRKISLLKTRLFWIDPKNREENQDPLIAILTKPSLKQRDIKKPYQYRIHPNQVGCPKEPDAHQLQGVLNGLTQRLQDQLQHPDTRQHLETYVQNIAHSLHNPHLMAIRLYPLYEALYQSLGLNPGHMAFFVRDTLDPATQPDNATPENQTQPAQPKRVTYGECRPVYDGAISETAKITTQIALSQSAFLNHYFQNLNPRASTPEATRQSRNEIARVILNTLIEEVVHAWQFQTMISKGDPVYLKQTLPQARILDYQECQAFHYPDFSLMKAYTGRSDLYEKNPIEVDAKWVANQVSKDIFKTLSAIPDAEPILLTPA